MEGDKPCQRTQCCHREISIHSLRMEGDHTICNKEFSVDDFSFQSTPSAWRETSYFFIFFTSHSHFNPLPPHGGRPWDDPGTLLGTLYFNPLPPHGGRPLKCRTTSRNWNHFNPLPPHGGRRTDKSESWKIHLFQSTPSAWRETISSCLVSICKSPNFNPLPPHGGRLHRFG